MNFQKFFPRDPIRSKVDNEGVCPFWKSCTTFTPEHSFYVLRSTLKSFEAYASLAAEPAAYSLRSTLECLERNATATIKVVANFPGRAFKSQQLPASLEIEATAHFAERDWQLLEVLSAEADTILNVDKAFWIDFPFSLWKVLLTPFKLLRR